MVQNMSARFSDVVYATLIEAGWFSGRQVKEETNQWIECLVHKGNFEIFTAAKDILLEFGGLKIDRQEVGEECACESIDLDPVRAMYEEGLFFRYSSLLGEKLFPLGEAGGGHVFLAVSKSGRIFLVMEDIWLVGENFDDALEHLVRGLKPIPFR